MKKCREIMTEDPVTCHPDDSVVTAARLMKEKDVGPVPVVSDGDKKLLGILTDRDIVLNVVATGKAPDTCKVRDVMTPDPVCCHPDDNVRKALEAMAKYQVRRIPVVEKGGTLVGIIAQADIAASSDEEKTGEVVREISEPANVH